MTQSFAADFQKSIASLDPKDTLFATRFVDALLASAKSIGASDIHIQPSQLQLRVSWRLDGVLHPVGTWPVEVAPNVVARLKVLASLLTYRTDVPQEGRIPSAADVEMRLSTIPVVGGEKAVVRIFGVGKQLQRWTDLQFPDDITSHAMRILAATSGAWIIAGPAGSGKTTSLYACMRELASTSRGARSLCSIEDPVEISLENVAQSQVNLKAGFDLANALKSLMRQDPEVIMVGEIRDRATAETLLEASLTGHLVLTSFHAGSAAGAINRLQDMGIEPYILRSGILAIQCQRLVRQLCRCSLQGEGEAGKLGLNVQNFRVSAGCPECSMTGYQGRRVLAELLPLDNEDVGQAVLDRREAASLQAIAVKSGMIPLLDRARQAVEQCLTAPAEVRRVFGV